MRPEELDRRAHQEWLGYLQPSGLVVSATALVAAQAFPQKNIIPEQQKLLELVGENDPASLDDFPRFTREFLGWEAGDLAGGPSGPELPEILERALPEYGETLRPSYAVPDPENPDSWLLLVRIEPRILDLDKAAEGEAERRWNASPQLRFERLLRENAIPIGILSNAREIRLVYAPRGESTGFLTFPVSAMCEVAGRPIVSAIQMLLSADRVFPGPVETARRLPAILRLSRKYQNEVSTRLAGQVQAALYELLGGFQAANAATKGDLLRDVLKEAPQEVYGGLLGTLLRLVFILYAEDRGLLSSDPVYQEHYSVGRLFERLRDDQGRYADTMDSRYGAWAQLLTLFRLIHDGATHGGLRLPPRHGRLFNPDTWDFLEGRPWEDVLDRGKRLDPPRVPDGVVYRVLENLLMLDGERISYRALDVEQIGSVYEAMMGFELQIATRPSVAVRPDHVVVDLTRLLEAKPADRLKRLDEEAGCKLSGKAADGVKAADSVEALIAALHKRISPFTPQPIAKGGLLLQPTDERRRSGSHYTPRSLTEPIVRTTLEPILKGLGENPRPEQILALKVCDPAMGSGAFLVEACRFLGDALVASWQAHAALPRIPLDEDPVLHARRLVAARCLYGVDKNRFAVDLAKLSLWLATLAKDHAFTFLDHALCHGDSLVGLTREQVASFHWQPEKQIPLIRDSLKGTLELATDKRAALHALGDEGDAGPKARLHHEATRALRDIRLCGDLVIAAFFGKEKDKDREVLRTLYADQLLAVLEGRAGAEKLAEIVAPLYDGSKPVPPFHWEIEFPEVFSRDTPGFDAFVGNPPFLGGTRVSTVLGMSYFSYLTTSFPPASHLCDLVAYFFRQAFFLLRHRGAFGLVATNTVAQGDTRNGGLTPICLAGGTVYSARRRVRWPGKAAVVVSQVHVIKGQYEYPRILDGRSVQRISAYLFHEGGDQNPVRLRGRNALFSAGSKIYGQGFLFDDADPEASPISEMRSLLESEPRYATRILPYIGGEEVNGSPTQTPHRYVIFLSDLKFETDLDAWPALAAIVRSKVKPERDRLGSNPNNIPLKKRWWAYQAHRPELYNAIRGLDRVLANCQVGPHLAFAFQPSARVFAHTLNVFALPSTSAFAVLQARPHEGWARFFSSSMKDDMRYTPSDCFETFPFPEDWQTNARIEEAGRAYYDFRAALMVRNDEGLTKTYNRFHDPEERNLDILKLRDLHNAMDRVVLGAYLWTDLQPKCEFLLDYEDHDSEGDDDAKPRKRRKPWRYRWPDDVRDEVLARLLALNAVRAKEEALAGVAASGTGAAATTQATKKAKGGKSTGSLLD